MKLIECIGCRCVLAGEYCQYYDTWIGKIKKCTYYTDPPKTSKTGYGKPKT